MPAEFPINTTNQLVQVASQHTGFDMVSAAEANDEIQALLRRLNLGVQDSFAAGGVHAMETLTTPEGYVIMQQKYARWISRQIVELNLVSCEFLAFDLLEDGSRARAYTIEKWVYVYADGRAVSTPGSVNGYNLQWTDGQWRVGSAATYSVEGD